MGSAGLGFAGGAEGAAEGPGAGIRWVPGRGAGGPDGAAALCIPRIFRVPEEMTRTCSAVSIPWARTISSIVWRGPSAGWLLNSVRTSAASSCVRKLFLEATAMKVISKLDMKYKDSKPLVEWKSTHTQFVTPRGFDWPRNAAAI